MNVDSVIDLACSGVTGAADSLASAARVARFLRGRRHFEQRPDDIYIASYPRSGTTLTQWIVYLLNHDTDTEFEHISHVSPWWERSLAWRNGAAGELNALPGPRVFKTHLLRRWLPSRARYIYVVRDGRDVAVSYYHLYVSHLAYTGSFERFWDQFLAGKLQYGSWFKHVAHWQKHKQDDNVLWLDFEALRDDLRGGILRIADFLAIHPSSATLDRVHELASLSSMKAMQDKFDHAGEILYQRQIRRGQFIRTGRIQQHVDYLSAQQQSAFLRAASRNGGRGTEWRIHEFLR